MDIKTAKANGLEWIDEKVKITFRGGKGKGFLKKLKKDRGIGEDWFAIVRMTGFNTVEGEWKTSGHPELNFPALLVSPTSDPNDEDSMWVQEKNDKVFKVNGM